MKRFLFSILSLIIFCTACFGGVFILSGCDKANEKAGGFEESKIENNASGNWTDSGNYALSFAGGNGRTSPYLIETPQQLARMAYLVNNSGTTVTYNQAYYKLIADIDLSAYGWVAIVAFRGVFEGGGHTITGLNITYGQYTGLFMSVIDAKISNIIIGNNNETINLTSYRAGAIAGYAGGSTLISHCTLYSNIEAGNGATGGIVGYATDTAKIEYCKNLGNFIRTPSSSPVIQSDFSTGGIVGQIKVDGTTGVVISKCYNEAQVSGICYVGGIVGSAIYTVNEEFPEGISIFNEIKNCYNTGEIRGNYYVGGIIGKSAYMYSGVHIGDALSLSNCYNSSIIRANDSTQSEFLGGIAGDIGVAKNCFALTEIMGISLSSTQTHRAGILFGRAYCCLEQAALSFSMCYYSGNVRSPYGVAAYSANTTIINLEEGLVRATPSVQFVDEEFFRDTSNWYGDGDSELLWDFDNVWAIDENINNGYPYLKKPTQTVRVYSASQILELTSDEVDFENAVWQVDSGNFYKEVEVEYGTEISVTAVETSSIDFVKWGEEYLINGQYITYTLTTSPTYTFTVLYDTILRADFDITEAYINQYYYRKNDGTTGSFSQSHYGSFVILGADEADDMYDQNGWVFYSWGRTRSAVTGSLPGQSISSSSNASLFAISNRNVTVSYDGNGGTYSGEDTTGLQRWNQYGNVLQSSAMTITSTVPNRPGYVFKGWSADSSATEPTYTSGASFTFTSAYNEPASVTMFAVWESDILTITLDMGGGTGSVGVVYLKYSDGFYLSQNCTEGTKFTALNVSSLPKRTGYTFEGYYTEDGILIMDKYGMVQTNRDEFTTTDTTIYAHWEVKNEAKFDEEKGYWYVEMGIYPQTRLEDEVKIAELDEMRVNSQNYSSYNMDYGYLFLSYLYGDEEYAYSEETGHYYLVEPVRYILSGDYSEGDAIENGSILAVTEKVVYGYSWGNEYNIGDFEVGPGEGYISCGTAYLFASFAELDLASDPTILSNIPNLNVKNFKTASGETVVDNDNLLFAISSREDMDEVVGDGNYAVEFSDLVADLLGGNLLYYTRDVGSNLGNAECISAGGITGLQMRMEKFLGTRITVNFSTVVCVST